MEYEDLLWADRWEEALMARDWPDKNERPDPAGDRRLHREFALLTIAWLLTAIGMIGYLLR